MDVLFIQTGGTIDKDYPRLTYGYAFEITDPAVERILEQVHPTFKFRVNALLKKDSQELTESDRQRIRSTCKSSRIKRIIITHGTDTMLATAAALEDIPGKTIIITGAMRPERFANSDAAFNIGLALGALEFVPPGVYIAMNGQVIPADQCERKFNTGQFVRKSQQNT